MTSFTSIKYYVDQEIDYDAIAKDLVDYGYTKRKEVLQEGDFALRGSILDVYPTNFDAPIRMDVDDDRIQSIYTFNLITGKNIWQHKMVILFPFKKARQGLPFQEDLPLNHFVDIQAGDYVVHNYHGIGKYLGVKNIEGADQKKEHFIIEYKDEDRLFVPKHDLHLVQKYVGFNKKPPRLFKLGNKEWEKIKSNVERRIRKMASELLRMQALRESMPGFSYPADDQWLKSFEKAFPFEETEDQKKAIVAVKEDMQKSQPMDRLICGDVGYGKTEVAIRAAFKAVMNGKQVAVLVPTTILAEQHFYNFSQRMADYPVTVEMLSRFRTKKEQNNAITAAKEGSVDILIGTHRLLSKDVGFKDLGLIIIDEEQRFGVKSKEKLKHLRLLADVLTLSATPIPRTLYMALAGSRDLSIISTPPYNRKPVQTHVIEFDEEIIQMAIERELKRKGQVFFLHNRVDDIDLIAAKIKRLVPQARIDIGHGQMPGRLLEEVMLRFLKHETDILVCTTIVESGIDIPNANTLIINRADHFGLSDLHQLRGRVGRLDRQAYAYFITPPKHHLSTIAKQRLQALQKYSNLGAGFHIAFEDLQIRGAGNLLGEEQHGYVASVGFDLYCRLLKQAVEQLKQEMEIQHVANSQKN